MQNIEQKENKELCNEDCNEDEEFQKRYKELCNEDWYKEVEKKYSIMRWFRMFIKLCLCIGIPGCLTMIGYVDDAILCLICGLLLFAGGILTQIILDHVRKTEDLETGGESMKRKRIYIKDAGALLDLLVCIGILIPLISIIALGITSGVLVLTYGVDKADVILDKILTLIGRGIIGVAVVAVIIFLVFIIGFYINIIYSFSKDAIGFMRKEEMELEPYNECVEKVAKSVSNKIHKKAGKYNYEKEVFQKDVIKTLKKMMKKDVKERK